MVLFIMVDIDIMYYITIAAITKLPVDGHLSAECLPLELFNTKLLRIGPRVRNGLSAC
jgi:hypothetical protein